MTRSHLTFSIHTLAICMLASCAADAQEWTRFRGPNGSGVSEAKTVPVEWDEDDYNWRIDLPGEGHSSPVIWGDNLLVTSADVDARERNLLCINTGDGAVRWRASYPFDKFKANNKNTFATQTPCVDARRVYCLWQAASDSLVVAVDHAGKEVWRHDLGEFQGGHGPATSPIVFGDMVVVCNDQERGAESFLIALDAATGKERWKIERIGDRACYSTPCVYQVEGRRPVLIFTHSYRGISGVDPAAGKIVWQIDVFGTHNQRAIGSPVIFGDLVIGSSGFTTAEKTSSPCGPRARGRRRP